MIATQTQTRLAELETVIERGQRTFVEVGKALAEIRDSRLYKEEFGTFEDYCREKWGWTRVRAYQLIDAAGVAESLPESVKHVLQNDRQAGELSRVEPELRVEVLDRAAESGPVTAASIREAAFNHRAQGTGENEWYTPPQYIEAARACLGEIDLDPASSALAQQSVLAKRFYSIDDNGLNQKWTGKVWLNPPYAQPAIQQFCEKMVSEFIAGNVVEAIMLTHNYTDTAWFHIAEAEASAICFTRGRIRFVSPSGEIAAPTQGQAFFYYGNRRKDFELNFNKFGFIR